MIAGLRRRLTRPARLVGAASARLRNEVVASSFGDRAGRNGMVPNRGIAVFFATGPENLYQFDQWRLPLERLAERRPVFVITDRADTGAALLERSTLPLAFARGSAALEELVEQRDLRAVLYLNQVEANFRMLRFPGPVHVQIGHGESDKAGSVSNQHKAYDLTFVGGPAGSERLAAALRNFDLERRTRQIGRPQLDHDYPGAPDWPTDSGRRIWYAPTWEGDRPSIAYGSLVSHGEGLIEALLADPDVRIIYRPHPRTGTASAAYAEADQRIRGMLRAADDRHLIDEGPYGWQWQFADACITDISAAAYDWLATGKPLVITEPAPTAYRPISPLLDRTGLLRPHEVGTVLSQLAQPAPADLSRHYFGDTAEGASSRRFAAAIDALLD